MKAVRLATLAALGIALAACHFGGNAETIDAGDHVERDVAIGAYQRVAVSGPYDVEIKADGQPGIHVAGGENIVDDTEFVVEDGVLKIRSKRKSVHWRRDSDDQKVRVTVGGGGAITGASISGSGDVAVERVKSASFKGEVAGSGNLKVPVLDTGDAEFSIAGSGDIRAGGKAQSVKMNIAGSGDIDAGGLIASDGDLNIAGSGNITAHLTGAADINVMGSGDVNVTGGAKCQVSKSGSGHVNCS
jgi:hypothetical protein